MDKTTLELRQIFMLFKWGTSGKQSAHYKEEKEFDDASIIENVTCSSSAF